MQLIQVLLSQRTANAQEKKGAGVHRFICKQTNISTLLRRHQQHEANTCQPRTDAQLSLDNWSNRISNPGHNGIHKLCNLVRCPRYHIRIKQTLTYLKSTKIEVQKVQVLHPFSVINKRVNPAVPPLPHLSDKLTLL